MTGYGEQPDPGRSEQPDRSRSGQPDRPLGAGTMIEREERGPRGRAAAEERPA